MKSVPVANAMVVLQRHNRTRRISAPIAAVLLVVSLAATAKAQLGTGWTSATYTKKIHLDDDAGLQIFNWTSSKSVCTPVCADYSYDTATDTETFRLLDGRTNRSEIRLQNDYTTGIRQFEGYVTFFSPLNDESLFQIFGSTDGATLCMMRGYSASGGKIHVVGGIGDIQTNTYGIERRINVIHNQDKYVQFYVDGVLRGEFSENEQVSNYWKYGDYGTVASDTVPAVVKWRAVRTFTTGLPPGAVASPAGAYEAEDAVLTGPTVSASQTGFSGTGFADFANSSGDSIKWTVNAQTAGLYDLKFRYALQSSDRPLEVRINGQLVNSSFDFPATGSWTTWQYATLQSRQLLAGTNTVEVTAIGSSGPNLDHLLLGTLANFYGDYNQNGVVDAADYLLWRRTKGTVVPRGTGADGNANGIVDDDDYNFWRARYGTTVPRGSGALPSAAIPEPTGTLTALIIAILLLLLRGEHPKSA
jgi:hypothetical protein